MSAPRFPGWLAASLTLAAGVWVVEQANPRYAWAMAALALLSVLVVRVRQDPTVLQNLYLPWNAA